MRRPAAFFLSLVGFLAALVTGQLSPDDALARLKARQARAAAGTQPASQAAATTRPGSLKDARRIVFVVDTQYHPVRQSAFKEELNLAVEHLRDDQLFTIIVMAVQGQAPRAFNSNPTRATGPAKAAARDFINAIQDDRKTNPLPAIRKAVELEPDLLYYIVEDNTTQGEMVRRAFGPLHGRLNIMLFSGLMPHPDEFLRTLAIEHGGKAINQRGDELQPPAPKLLPGAAPVSRPSILEK
jgi:hypothetical protein